MHKRLLLPVFIVCLLVPAAFPLGVDDCQATADPDTLATFLNLIDITTTDAYYLPWFDNTITQVTVDGVLDERVWESSGLKGGSTSEDAKAADPPASSPIFKSPASPVRAPKRVGGAGLNDGRLILSLSTEMSLLHFGQIWLKSKLI